MQTWRLLTAWKKTGYKNKTFDYAMLLLVYPGRQFNTTQLLTHFPYPPPPVEQRKRNGRLKLMH